MRFTDDYHHESEEEKEQQTSKKPDKKEPPKKPKDDLNKFNKWINKKETGINHELFNKHFNFKGLVICLNLYILQMIETKMII